MKLLHKMKVLLKKFFIFAFLLSSFSQLCTAEGLKSITLPFPKWWEPANLSIFRQAYPEVEFISEYDSEKNDWLIHIKTKTKNGQAKATSLYWCESRFLPEKELKNKDNFRPMLYPYQLKTRDPSTFTEKEIELIKDYTSRENRKNGAIEPPFFHNAIFDCETRASTESHIKTYEFLTLQVNVHEQIYKPLKRVHKRVMELPRDEEMDRFLKSLTRTDGFAWRSVRDTQSRSYHSIGLAIDILPKGYYQRIIYWGWQKQLRPDDWYMTPLSKRWTPPQRVIDIFAEEGFIWGGNWVVWDNMHFEYHPELIIYAKKNNR